MCQNKKQTKTLIVDSLDNENLIRSSRNVQKTKVVNSYGVNIYDLIYHEKLLITKAAIEELNNLLDPKREKNGATETEEPKKPAKKETKKVEATDEGEEAEEVKETKPKKVAKAKAEKEETATEEKSAKKTKVKKADKEAELNDKEATE